MEPTAMTYPTRAVDTMRSKKSCMFCGNSSLHSVVDLGMSPLCESYLVEERLNSMEPFFPLHVFVCDKCFLVQLEEYVSPAEIFSEYAYFSSFADSWVQHMKQYADQVIGRFGLNERSFIVEVASNDGYLLKHFVARRIPVLGIEPAANIARVAIERGIPTLIKFFGVQTAQELAGKGRLADLIAGANVLAQVPAINDFVGGLKILLASRGVITIEFPHLLRLIGEHQFDTIYH